MKILLLIFNFAILSTMFAEVTLAPIFSSNMLLQRNVEIPLRGLAQNEKTVLVSFNGQEYQANVEENKWSLNLPPMKAGGDYTIVVKGSNTITLKKVTFGDVWLCAGQSNMDSAIETYKKKFPELYEGHPVAEHDQIRIFRAARVRMDEPQEFIEREHRFADGWYRITKKTRTRLFSATAYFFGLHLTEKVDVPIGLIQSCRGGTPIQAWLPEGVLESHAKYTHILEEHQRAVSAWPEEKIKLQKKIKEWEAKKAAGKKAGWKPEADKGPESKNRPYALHNGMIAPLYKLPIKGVLWYQGEGSVMSRERALQYEDLLKDLVKSWREKWQNENMPFLVVQLPGLGKISKKPRMTENRPWTRESQKKIEAFNHCKTVCTVDSGMQQDNHPPYKENVGKRLAYAALQMVYDQKDSPLSPEYLSHESSEDSTIITFKNCGSGLILKKPLITDNAKKEGEVLSFLAMDASGEFRRVQASIFSDNQIKVLHPEIPMPKAFRYAWEGFPNVNLFGPNDMPVFPFRTDG